MSKNAFSFALVSVKIWPMKRYRIDRRPIRYQQWPYWIIAGVLVVYLPVALLWKAATWVWSLF